MIASPLALAAQCHWAYPTARAARLDRVLRKVRQGIYRPNPADIAERLLAVSELESERRSVWA